MNRRGFIVALAAGTVAGLAGCAAANPVRAADTAPVDPVPTPLGSTRPAVASSTAPALPSSSSPPSSLAPVPPTPKTWPDEIVTGLPGTAHRLALTIDDGTSTEVVAAYARFATDTGARLTFFLNGFNDSWTDNASALRPLVDSGQVQLANHTWDHQDLRNLSDAEIREELNHNDRFVRDTYGVTTRPYLRPPYGFHNWRTRRVAAEEGYSTSVLWYGSLGDSQILTENEILANARQWIAAERIVIGHANHPSVTHVYGELVEIIRQRSLSLVTLDDVFLHAR